MNQLLEQMIGLHAKHGAEGVEQDPAFQAMCESHRSDTGFNSMLNQLRDVARQLEDGLHDLTPREQVGWSLRIFNSFRREKEKQAICRELTRRRFYGTWTREQRAHFDQASEKLEHWSDYFLSFTNFNPAEGEVIFVNNEYKRLITEGLGRRIGPPETMKKNLLARLLQYRLENKPLQGFFYPEHRDPQEVEPRLKQEARRSFAFVQLLQSSMFNKWPNFCKIEYDAAAEDPSKTLIFVMAENRAGFISRELVDNRLHNWYDGIMARDALELEPARTSADIRATLNEIQERVVLQVESARRSLFEHIPL